MTKLTQEVVDELFDLYRNIAGCNHGGPRLRDVLSDLEDRNYFEYRAGSKWGPCKFVIHPARGVNFHPNFDLKGEKEKMQIEQAQDLFQRRAGEYIDSLMKDN